MMFKYSKGELPTPISTLFTRNNDCHHYNTRHSASFHIARGNSELIYKCFSVHAIRIWNPISIVVLTNVAYAHFKYLLFSIQQSTFH